MLPKEINVMKVVTYDVAQILDDFAEHMKSCENQGSHNSKRPEDVTVDDCIEWISDWVLEDFGTDYGLIYQDENGKEL